MTTTESDIIAIDWSTGTSGLRRGRWRIPGYDCRTECRHEPKGEHGWCGDRWCYAVASDRGAIALEALTAYFNDNAELNAESLALFARLFRLRPLAQQHAQGATLSLHLTFPTERRGATAVGGVSGCLLASPACYDGGGTFLGAGTVFAEHGDADHFEQPEKLWLALEDLFGEWMATAEADRVKP